MQPRSIFFSCWEYTVLITAWIWKPNQTYKLEQTAETIAAPIMPGVVLKWENVKKESLMTSICEPSSKASMRPAVKILEGIQFIQKMTVPTRCQPTNSRFFNDFDKKDIASTRMKAASNPMSVIICEP